MGLFKNLAIKNTLNQLKQLGIAELDEEVIDFDSMILRKSTPALLLTNKAFYFCWLDKPGGERIEFDDIKEIKTIPSGRGIDYYIVSIRNTSLGNIITSKVKESFLNEINKFNQSKK